MKKKKILIYQVGVIGDTIVALPAIRAILQRHSSDEVHILNLHYSQKNFQLDLLKDLPENKEKVEFEYFQSIKTVSGFISRIKLFSKIRKEKYDTAYMIVLYGVAKSLLKTFRYFTGIQQIFYTEYFRKKILVFWIAWSCSLKIMVFNLIKQKNCWNILYPRHI